MALGAAKKEAGRFYALLKTTVPAADQAVSAETFFFHCDRPRLRVVRRREGRYLLRSNLTGRTPAQLWTFYMQLVQVEEAFKNLKGDLRVRPVYHQKLERIEAQLELRLAGWTRGGETEKENPPCLRIPKQNERSAILSSRSRPCNY